MRLHIIIVSTYTYATRNTQHATRNHVIRFRSIRQLGQAYVEFSY